MIVSLLRIEWLKIKKYPAFWWMLGMVALTYPGVNLIFYNVYKNLTLKKDTGAIAQTLFGNPFAFPETWHSVAYFSSCFVTIPAILVIMIITNEYSFKTHRQNIIDGWSRSAFITSKIFDVAIISIVATIMYVLTAVVYGFWLNKTDTIGWTTELHYIPLFLLQTFAQLSLAFFLGFIIRKSFIALGIFMFYVLIVENILVGILKFKKIPLGRFLPLEISDKLIPSPKFIGNFNEEAYTLALAQVNQHIALTIVFTAFIWGACFYIYERKDL